MAGTPSREDTEGWLVYRKVLVRSYTDITKFYIASDQSLERWLPGVPENPPRGAFMSAFQDALRHLEEELVTKHKVVIGSPEDDSVKIKAPGFNWEKLDLPMWDQVLKAGASDEQKVLKELQKRFWARQRVANLVLQSGVKVSRIVDFRFFKKLHPNITQAPWETPQQGNKEAVQWQGVGADAQGQARGFQETLLPNELGQTITFGFALELPYDEVTKAIREIVTPGTQAQNNEMLVNLVGTHVTIHEQNDRVVTITYPKGDMTKKAEETAKALENSKRRDVILTVTCQIIDFEPSKAKPFAAK